MMQASQPIAARRPTHLLGRSASGRHKDLDTIAGRQVDRCFSIAQQKTIRNEIHACLSNRRDRLQDRRPPFSFEISGIALRGAQFFRIE
jgi:hypothetical protein